MEQKYVFVNTPMSKKTKVKLQKIAKETERSLAAVVRHYINLGLASEQPKASQIEAQQQ